MKTITVKMANNNDVDLLRKFLSTTKFKAEVETYEEDDEFSEEELQIFSERWEKYEKNPSSSISLKNFKKELKNKHGL